MGGAAWSGGSQSNKKFEFDFSMMAEPDSFSLALEEIKKGNINVHAASIKYKIPKSTLYDHVQGRVKKRIAGHPTVLSQEEEKEIATTCEILQLMAFPMNKETVGLVVQNYLTGTGRENPFKDGIPGEAWWRGFLRRWPSITYRRPQYLPRNRAEASNPVVIKAWLEKVRSFLTDHEMIDMPDLENRMWNCDETGFCTSMSSKSVLARKGSRNVYECGGGTGHEYYTVLGCGSASGTRLPPFILYKGKNMYQRWIQGGPAGAVYGVSDSGWMEGQNFLSWFEKSFVPAIKHLISSGPIILFVDGHHSHTGIDLILKSRKQGIHILCLPPHTTHILQPLDVGVYGPIKTTWRTILRQHRIETRAEEVTKENFPGKH